MASSGFEHDGVRFESFRPRTVHMYVLWARFARVAEIEAATSLAGLAKHLPRLHERQHTKFERRRGLSSSGLHL